MCAILIAKALRLARVNKGSQFYLPSTQPSTLSGQEMNTSQTVVMLCGWGVKAGWHIAMDAMDAGRQDAIVWVWVAYMPKDGHPYSINHGSQEPNLSPTRWVASTYYITLNRGRVGWQFVMCSIWREGVVTQC